MERLACTNFIIVKREERRVKREGREKYRRVKEIKIRDGEISAGEASK